MAEVGVLRNGELRFEDALLTFRKELPKEVGGIGCFIGVVKGVARDGRMVEKLCYECADEMADELRNIAEDAERMPGVRRVAIHCIIDELVPGEDTIYVLVAGDGRKEVFSALQTIMDRVKKESHIRKKEVTKDGEHWEH